MTGHKLLHQSQPSHHSYPTAPVEIKTDGILPKTDDARKLEGPADKLGVRARIQNNLCRLEHGLTSVKCNNQHWESEIHMNKHRFIYKSSHQGTESRGVSRQTAR